MNRDDVEVEIVCHENGEWEWIIHGMKGRGCHALAEKIAEVSGSTIKKMTEHEEAYEMRAPDVVPNRIGG